MGKRLMTKDCPKCGSQFKGYKNRIFCSRSCAAKVHAAKYKKNIIEPKDAHRPKTNMEWKRLYITRHPEKHKARNIIYQAIRSGAIIRGICEKCGEKKTEAHHDDYSKPKDVRWLCRKHHLQWHKENDNKMIFQKGYTIEYSRDYS